VASTATGTGPAQRRAAPSSGAPAEPTFAEHVCLALVVEGVSHGWALGTLLGPDGEIGRIWSLSRPLTYRAVEQLVGKGLLVRTGRDSGHGRDRVVLAASLTGRRVSEQWLDAPVEHLRDVRTELLVKLALRERMGRENGPLLAAQRARFEPFVEALTSVDGQADGTVDLVDLWRRESARAVRRFLDQALEPAGSSPANALEMRLSARNQVRASVVSVQHGEVMSRVQAVLGDGQPVTAAITEDAVRDLDLAPGDPVVMIVKSTEMMIAKAR
jgi:molybdopterin-binding protein